MTTQDKAIYISGWIKKYAEDAGMNGLVCGVSGGIDSAVVSTLCAMTKLPCKFYNIPIYSSRESSKMAFAHMEWLRENFSNTNWGNRGMDNVFSEFEKIFPLSPLAKANTKARLRMAYLYAIANNENMLVVGCGNKIEFELGFFTVGGDGCSGLFPIGDLLKSEVYELGKHLKVSDEILNASPTDGLYEDDRTDEDSFGATYKELEEARQNILCGNYDIDRNKNGLSDRQNEVMDIYIKLQEKNSFKTKLPPVCKIFR